MPMTQFPLPPLMLDRRKLLLGGAGAAAGLLLPSLASAQTKFTVPEGTVAPIDPAAFIDRITDSDKQPQFQNWKTINAQALVVGRTTRQNDGRLKAEFRLWDVASGQQLAGQSFVTAPE